MKKKHIFITGGVVSSLGKGIASASIGLLLKRIGYNVIIQKLDPYLNVDPGTMNPFQHGEVFVTDDGAETDLDLGHYERFLCQSLTKDSNSTTGQIYRTVIEKERRGDYLGKTVQVIPHIIDEIKRRIRLLDKKADIIITEIGGTVGDIESLPFLEAIRQYRLDIGKENTLFIHLALVPYIKTAGESKTKPIQHSVHKLREIGIQPDILLCRAARKITKEMRQKIALFTNVPAENVIDAQDVPCVYQVPINFYLNRLPKIISQYFHLDYKEIDLSDWQEVVNRYNNPKKQVSIALCGKYVRHQDAYKSIIESLIHSGIYHWTKVNIKYIDTDRIFHNFEKSDFSSYEDFLKHKLNDVDGILVPGGFGVRGIEGKIQIIKHSRENNIPFFGICLGMQCAIIEFARNVLHLEHANSIEFDAQTKYPVIDLMIEQKHIRHIGGTMRLGAYTCLLAKNSFAEKIYSSNNHIDKNELVRIEKTKDGLLIKERHRHRYEFNNKYRDKFAEKGMRFSGIYPKDNLVEIIELTDHPFFIGVQFHPEFKSYPTKPQPIFREFIKSALIYQNERKNKE